MHETGDLDLFFAKLSAPFRTRLFERESLFVVGTGVYEKD